MGGAVTRQFSEHCAVPVGMLFERPAADVFLRAADGYRSISDVVIERPAKLAWSRNMSNHGIIM